MKAKLTKPGVLEPILSVLIVLIIMYLGYAWWLHMQDQHLQFQIEALKKVWAYAPPWAVRQLEHGGWLATVTGMWLLASYREVYVVLGILGGVVGLVAYHYANPRKKTKPAETDNDNHILQLNSPLVYVTVPAVSKDPVAEQFLRLDRKDVALRHEVTTPVQKLERAVLEVLYAHRQHPADPAGHHAATPLFEHSLAVAKKLQTASTDPLARVAGLAHDIGKIVAYKSDPEAAGGWKVVVTNHHTQSANLMRLLPEYNGLSEDDQRVLRYALKYYHTPILAPAQTPPRARLLMQKLRIADGLVTGTENRSVASLAGDKTVVAKIANVILEVIPTLNINRVRKDALADGFTGIALDYCAIQESALRSGISTHLQDEAIIQALALRHDKMKGTEHPATAVIHQALRRTGLMLESYQNITPANGRFDVKSGTTTFRGCYLLSRGKLERAYPDEVRSWGEKWEYQLKILDPNRPRGEHRAPSPAPVPE